MKRCWGVLLVVLVAACSGGSSSSTTSGGTSDGDAGKVAVQELQFVVNGQFGPEYDLLHPAQQAKISKSQYLNCAQSPGLPSDTKFTVKATYHEPVDIPGTDLKNQDSVAVTVEINAGSRGTQTATFHEFLVNGQFRWSLQQSNFDSCVASVANS